MCLANKALFGTHQKVKELASRSVKSNNPEQDIKLNEILATERHNGQSDSGTPDSKVATEEDNSKPTEATADDDSKHKDAPDQTENPALNANQLDTNSGSFCNDLTLPGPL